MTAANSHSESNGDADVHVQQNQGPHQNGEDRRAHGRRRVQVFEEMVVRSDDNPDHDPDKGTERDAGAPSHLGTFTVTVARLNLGTAARPFDKEALNG
jgi:hypothetical protein